MKKIVLVLLILLLTGCSIEYNLKINKDLTVEERIEAVEENDFFKLYEYTNKIDVINFIFEPYLEEIDAYSYNYDIISNDEFGGMFIKRKYSSLQDYINNVDSIYYLFENVDYSEYNNIVTLKTTGKFYNYNLDDPERPAIENAKIIIEPIFEVIESNADEVVKNSRYIWIINKNTLEKNITISFDKTKRIDVINISDKIKIDYTLLIIIVILLGFVILGLKLINQDKKNNKI